MMREVVDSLDPDLLADGHRTGISEHWFAAVYHGSATLLWTRRFEQRPVP